MRTDSAPRITVVTPSYNQAQYLEQTIRSVLDQGYPDLEYIIVDGGSTDGSADIIRKYAHRLAYWVSEKDEGQADAINKGMRRATGVIRAYINSDDYYLPGAFERVARAWREHPDADLFHGDCRIVDESGAATGTWHPDLDSYEDIVNVWGVWWRRHNFVQPEVFWTARVAERIGPFRSSLYMVMDYEYWLRALREGARVASIDAELAAFRLTSTQKSNQRERCSGEILDVLQEQLWDRTAPLTLTRRLYLQGRWLYQARFLPQVSDSVARAEPRWRRLLGGLGVALRHPKVLLSEDYRERLAHAAGLRRKAE